MQSPGDPSTTTARLPHPMALLLLQLGAHPNEIAATRQAACVEEGAFFLDFSRPLGRLRWLGGWNRWLGLTMSLVVPVVHEREAGGWRTIAVDRWDPYFAELQRLWKERYPLARPTPTSLAPATRIAEDYARQFPHDRLETPPR